MWQPRLYNVIVLFEYGIQILEKAPAGKHVSMMAAYVVILRGNSNSNSNSNSISPVCRHAGADACVDADVDNPYIIMSVESVEC
jgi:hypothetical protein